MKCRRNVNDLAPLRDENGALVITAIFFGGVLIAFLEEKEKGINMNNNEKKEKKVINFPVYIPGKDDEHRMVFSPRMTELIEKGKEVIKKYNEGIEMNVIDNEYFFSKKYSQLLKEDVGLIESTLDLIEGAKINNNDAILRQQIEDSLDTYIRQFNVDFLDGCEEYNKRHLEELKKREAELIERNKNNTIVHMFDKK